VDYLHNIIHCQQQYNASVPTQHVMFFAWWWTRSTVDVVWESRNHHCGHRNVAISIAQKKTVVGFETYSFTNSPTLLLIAHYGCRQ